MSNQLSFRPEQADAFSSRSRCANASTCVVEVLCAIARRLRDESLFDFSENVDFFDLVRRTNRKES